MKKICFILICFICGVFHPSHLLGAQPAAGNENHLKYRFECTFQAKSTGVILFFFRYRVFYYSNASILLTAQKTDPRTFQFHFDGIDKTAYLHVTCGLSGKTLITGAADYDLKKARQILDKDSLLFKEKAPDFFRVIKQWKTFPFQILSRGKDVITFKRDINGVHRDCCINMRFQSIKYDKKYGFHFEVYSILWEMLQIYNHPFFPGSWQKLPLLEPGMEWSGPELDFSRRLNCIGPRVSSIVEKLVTFKQKRPFKLVYRVVSRTPGRLTIHGEAMPRVKIWGGYKIMQVTRKIDIRLPDGVVLGDTFHVDINKKEGKGGFVSCALTLIQ
jgi:hypothetical protein